MEVSSQALDLGRLNGTNVDIAVFTNLSRDHLDHHGTLANYEAAKKRLFDWPNLNCAVINRDDAMGRRLLAHLRGKVRTVAYGLETSNTSLTEPLGNDELLASNLKTTSTGMRFDVHSVWGRGKVEIPIFGIFNVHNALAVLGALLASHMPFSLALEALEHLVPVAGRMQTLGGGEQASEPLIVIDYAHTPDALEQTLIALCPVAQRRGGKLICLFGCGGNRDAGKRPLMGAVAQRLAHEVVLTSDNPRYEEPARIIDDIACGLTGVRHLRRIEDRASAILQTVCTASASDVILIAGKGHETTQDIQGEKRLFSDLDHARLALSARNTRHETCATQTNNINRRSL
jgi:UDP-N-acetylmuramoyl-L-alanyl-D-glutamate--2,6-diaminopimelate ligase